MADSTKLNQMTFPYIVTDRGVKATVTVISSIAPGSVKFRNRNMSEHEPAKNGDERLYFLNNPQLGESTVTVVFAGVPERGTGAWSSSGRAAKDREGEV